MDDKYLEKKLKEAMKEIEDIDFIGYTNKVIKMRNQKALYRAYNILDNLRDKAINLSTKEMLRQRSDKDVN